MLPCGKDSFAKQMCSDVLEGIIFLFYLINKVKNMFVVLVHHVVFSPDLTNDKRKVEQVLHTNLSQTSGEHRNSEAEGKGRLNTSNCVDQEKRCTENAEHALEI